jgi:hypothetical protein
MTFNIAMILFNVNHQLETYSWSVGGNRIDYMFPIARRFWMKRILFETQNIYRISDAVSDEPRTKNARNGYTNQNPASGFGFATMLTSTLNGMAPISSDASESARQTLVFHCLLVSTMALFSTSQVLWHLCIHPMFNSQRQPSPRTKHFHTHTVS